MNSWSRFFLFLAIALSLLVYPGCLSPPKRALPAVDRPVVISSLPAPEDSTFEAEAVDLEQRLRQTPPKRDLLSLVKRLRGGSGLSYQREAGVVSPDYELGAMHPFWLADQHKKSYYQVSARLLHKTPHAYFYVEDGYEVSLEGLRKAGDVFEDRIYPGVRAYFGGEPDPGVDDDPRITILHASLVGPTGYFSSADEYPRSINPYSNEREMIYINLRTTVPGTDRYNSTIAHEFQHMVHWNANSSQDTWVNEGMAELAVKLVGYTPSTFEVSFTSNPDTQLNAWAEDSAATLPHYGAAYLFLSYLGEHYGGYNALKDLVAEEARGINGVERYLARQAPGVTFDDIFKDWIVANYLDDSKAEGGRYGYEDLDVKVKATSVGALPARTKETVHQYAARYLDLGQLKGDYVFAFTGTSTVKLLANEAHSGRRQWWSNRGDGMDTSLTREFDLTGLEQATLAFSTWYDLEEDYDYAYVEISTDEGVTWMSLRGAYTTESDPNGNNLGFGYTGVSGGGSLPVWVDERIDLSPYVGQIVLVRFEYVTDDAYSGPGFAMDDVSIPELGYAYDAEAEEYWASDGFVLSGNVVPQRYFVQVVKLGPQPEVVAMPLSVDRRGQMVVRGDGYGRVVLIVAAAAPATSEPATYEYSVAPLPVDGGG